MIMNEAVMVIAANQRCTLALASLAASASAAIDLCRCCGNRKSFLEITKAFIILIYFQKWFLRLLVKM